MNLADALTEFSELLELASGTLERILKSKIDGVTSRQAVDEVLQIAFRLREISKDVRQSR